MTIDSAHPGRRSFHRLMLALGLLFAVVISAQLYHIVHARMNVVGDRHTVESYGFDLSNLTVDRKLLVTTDLPRDGQTVIDSARSVDMAEVARLNANPRRQFIAGSDEVVGVVLGVAARAYPVRFLFWHEIVHDELGGVPIAVTYSPVCDSAVVFDRRFEGKTLQFGYSGLLYNSNLLMYDKPAGGNSSLWSQLRMEAIAGSQAGKKLAALPMWWGVWSEWSKLHGDTTVFAGEPSFKDQYKGGGFFGVGSHPLKRYFEKGELRYPAAPLPPRDGQRQWMDRVTAEFKQGEWQRVETPSGPYPVVRSCWFAWFAMHPE